MTLEEQFARLIKTLQLIESEPYKWDVAGLEVEFGVARATVERDIRILRKWGTIQRKKGYFAAKDLKFFPTSFTASEALALVLAGTIAMDSMRIPPCDSMRSALKKIDTVLPDHAEALIQKMSKRVSVGVTLIRECNSEYLDTLSKAISSHNPVEIMYRAVSSGDTTLRVVDPYGLTFRFGAWYLIGHCHLRNEVRTFGVDRIRNLRVLDDHFKYPKDWDLEEYLKRGWALQADAEPEEVVLRFDKSIAPWIIDCKFHPLQKMTRQRDGSVLFKVTVAGVAEIQHWVLSFGDKVEVLSPDSLRDAVAAASRRMAAMYSAAGDKPGDPLAA